ncbi:hypothetical protein NDU88_004638 [Pleurodeles waltl]|uniref:Uncharacterized protein n=1 Tax=Pleurodeles waltl TaxID=8319 RepID=A0AAV7UFS2_PLEWA|nr:hypothetical protein NDU88_004638 [Pleurodeles waltl]
MLPSAPSAATSGSHPQPAAKSSNSSQRGRKRGGGQAAVRLDRRVAPRSSQAPARDTNGGLPSCSELPSNIRPHPGRPAPRPRRDLTADGKEIPRCRRGGGPRHNPAAEQAPQRVSTGAAPGALQYSPGTARSGSAHGAAAKTTPRHRESGSPLRAASPPPFTASRGRRRSQAPPHLLTARPASSWPGK